MSEENKYEDVIDFNGLSYYDENIKEYINEQLPIKSVTELANYDITTKVYKSGLFGIDFDLNAARDINIPYFFQLHEINGIKLNTLYIRIKNVGESSYFYIGKLRNLDGSNLIYFNNTDNRVRINIKDYGVLEVPYDENGQKNGDVSFHYLVLDDTVLTKTNMVEYVPTNDYNPATKKYVDDSLKALPPIPSSIEDIFSFEDSITITMDQLSTVDPGFELATTAEGASIKRYIYNLNNPNRNTESYSLIIVPNFRDNKKISQKYNITFPTTNSNQSNTSISLNTYTPEILCITSSFYSTTNTPFFRIISMGDYVNGYKKLYIEYNSDGSFKSVVKDNGLWSNNVLLRTNLDEYTPTSDYNPATKKYVDDSITAIPEQEILPIEKINEYGGEVTIAPSGIYKVTLWPTSFTDPYQEKIFYIDSITHKHKVIFALRKNHETALNSKLITYSGLTSGNLIYVGNDGSELRIEILNVGEVTAPIDQTGSFDSSTITMHKIADDSSVLFKTNTAEYIPTADYHPATKQYVDNSVLALPKPGVQNIEAAQDDFDATVTISTLSSDFKKAEVVIPFPFKEGSGSYFIAPYQRVSIKINSPIDAKSMSFRNIAATGTCVFTPIINIKTIISIINNVTQYILICDTGGGPSWYVYDDTGKLVSQESRPFTTADTVLTKTNEKAYTPSKDYHPSTKKYVDDSIRTSLGNINHFQAVDTLPSIGENNVIYLVPKPNAIDNNAKDEYCYINGKWELIGDTTPNLEGYVTEEQVTNDFTLYDQSIKEYINGEIDNIPEPDNDYNNLTNIPVYNEDYLTQIGGVKTVENGIAVWTINAKQLPVDEFSKIFRLNVNTHVIFTAETTDGEELKTNITSSYANNILRVTWQPLSKNFTWADAITLGMWRLNADGQVRNERYETMPYASAVLTKTNTTDYTPTSDYNPATKKYVDDSVAPFSHIDYADIENAPIYNVKDLPEITNGEIKVITSKPNESRPFTSYKVNIPTTITPGKLLFAGVMIQAIYLVAPDGSKVIVGGHLEAYLPSIVSLSVLNSVKNDGRKAFDFRIDRSTTELCRYETNPDGTIDSTKTDIGSFLTPAAALTKTNTVPYTPSTEYNPATKKYVDDSISNINIPTADITAAQVDAKITTLQNNALTKDNTTSYTPTKDYHPATKKYIDDKLLTMSNSRNLILRSGTAITNNNYQMAQWFISPTEGDKLSDGYGYLVAGTTYTATICITPASKVTNYQLYLSNAHMSNATFNVSGTAKQTVSVTFQAKYASGRTPQNDPYNAKPMLFRFPDNSTVTENSTLHWIKIEKGSVPTDWTPAPEDVNTLFNEVEELKAQEPMLILDSGDSISICSEQDIIDMFNE